MINTGITFEIHTGSNFEIIYEPDKQELIFQRCDHFKLPCVAGLLIKSVQKPFFETYNTKKILSKINLDDKWYLLDIQEEDLDNNNFFHEFEFLDSQENLIKSFPLHRKIPFIVYNGRKEFKIWNPQGDEED